MKNTKLSQLDTDQIHKATFEESHDAQRVVLVGAEKLNIEINETKLLQSIETGLKNIKIEAPKTDIIPFLTEKEVEKPVFIPQIERIEIPVIVKETEYVEKPVFIKEIEFKEIEKTVYVPKIEYI